MAYFGLPNQDPKTNPKVPYSDSDFITPVAAIQTLDLTGSIGFDLFLDGQYSFRIETPEGALWRESPVIAGAFDISEFEAGSGAGLEFLFENSLLMIADTALDVGQFVQTLGRFVAGDSGANTYEIVGASAGTADGGSFITLDSGLLAKGLFPSGIYNVVQWGAVGDGLTDVSAEWQAALDYAEANDGLSIQVPTQGMWSLQSSVDFPRNVTLYRQDYPPIIRNMGEESSRVELDGMVYVSASITAIIIHEGSGVSGMTLLNNGLSYPVSTTADYTGTGIFIDGFEGGNPAAHDTFIENMNIFGFEFAIDSDGVNNKERMRISDVKFDCLNGPRLREVRDVARLDNCSGWPWLTVHGAAANPETSYRSGIAYAMGNAVDWGQLTNCFSFHYEDGFVNNGGSTITFMGCQADSASQDTINTTTVGFNITGDSFRTRMIGCTSFANRAAYLIATTTSDNNHSVVMSDCSTWFGGPGGKAVIVEDGNLIMTGCNISNWDYAVFRQNNAGVVTVSACAFHDMNIAVFANDSAVTEPNAWIIGDNEYIGNARITADGAEVPGVPTVVAASTASPTVFARDMIVTGTTTINNFDQSAFPLGTFTLNFTDTVTVASTGNTNLLGGSNQTFTNGDTLTLSFHGLNFVEAGRGLN